MQSFLATLDHAQAARAVAVPEMVTEPTPLAAQLEVVAVQAIPRLRRREIHIFDEAQLVALYRFLKETESPLYPVVLTAGSTGMRRGEILGLRWRDINFDPGIIQISSVVEKTRHSLNLKEPKTVRSRRAVSIGPTLVRELRNHRRTQAESRLKRPSVSGA